ncbi:Atrial natriuretic peptide receptor 1 [Hypsibius exemplaris]|uniref:Guanylate cyclase n=1 Tax=Hypsibius exemplaris TaxID=2072580 RepID=A0A1W0WAS0_HYPEX|nr:Atrial natriuretic peptide receptor 1 [Hypsibius exemplaris]
MKIPVVLLGVITLLSDRSQYSAKVFKRSTRRLLAGASDVSLQNLTICWLMEEDSYYSSYNRSAPAVDLGIEHANIFVMPKSLKLQYVFINTGQSCSHTMYSAVSSVYDAYARGVTCNMFLGSTCSFTTGAIYGFANKFNIPIFGCPSVGTWSMQADAKRDDFGLLIQPAFGFSDLTDFLIRLLYTRSYKNIAVYRDDSYSLFQLISDTFMRYLREREPKIYPTTFVTAFRSLRYTKAMYTATLQATNEIARVYILLMHARAVRKFMLSAYELGYTQGEHVFFAIELYDLAYWGKIDPTIGDENDQVAGMAFQSVLVVSFFERKTTYDREFEKEIKTAGRDRYGYQFNPLEPLDPVLVAHYEAIMLYALTVTDFFFDGKNYKNGSMLIDSMTNATFEGFRGDEISIGDDQTRDRSYAVKFYDNVTDQFNVYQTFVQSVDNDTLRVVTALKFPSADGKLPPNEPVCGFRNDKCRRDGLSTAILTTVIVVPLLVFIGIMTGLSLVGYKFWKIRMEYNPNWWKIMMEDLNVKDNRAAGTSGSKKTLNSMSTHGTSNKSGFSSYVCEIFATYKGTTVGLTDVSEMRKVPTKELLEELTLLKAIDDSNLQHFIGIALGTGEVCEFVVAELCTKGTLSDILENEMIKLDWFFKNSMIRDVVHGMAYLHASPILSHGNLSSFTCLVDIRFTIKITDYGLPFFRSRADLQPVRTSDHERNMGHLLWRAPELLRQVMPPKGTQKGDVYSFAIVLQQIILRSDPFELPSDPLEMSDKEIIAEVIAANIPPVRPRVPRSSCSNELYDLMERCWEEIPIERPTFPKIKERLRKIIGNVGDNIVDLLFKRMEQYANDLEQKVADQTQQFMDEKNRSEQLLSQLLPKPVAEALTRGVQVDPEAFASVTIFFSDIVGFTTISAKGSPMDVIDLLNSLYTFFDSILEKYDVYKVETIGDAYMVSSGLPVRNGNKHASEIANMALDLRTGIALFVVPNKPNDTIQIRIGINSGPCVAGIVGLKMPRYCLFGDTVNVASRMESTGEPMKIQISTETRDLLSNIGGFVITDRGPVMIKGKGNLVTFWLVGKQ